MKSRSFFFLLWKVEITLAKSFNMTDTVILKYRTSSLSVRKGRLIIGNDIVRHKVSALQPRSQGPLSTSRKYPGYGWSRVHAGQPKPHRGWVLNLILSTLSREVNVPQLQKLIFWKVIKLFFVDPAWSVFRLYLNLYEMLIERELCLYFTALLKNRQQPASPDKFKLLMGDIQLGATFLT